MMILGSLIYKEMVLFGCLYVCRERVRESPRVREKEERARERENESVQIDVCVCVVLTQPTNTSKQPQKT